MVPRLTVPIYVGALLVYYYIGVQMGFLRYSNLTVAFFLGYAALSFAGPGGFWRGVFYFLHCCIGLGCLMGFAIAAKQPSGERSLTFVATLALFAAWLLVTVVLFRGSSRLHGKGS